MTDSDAVELIVQFSARGKEVVVKASIRDDAATWRKEHPPGLLTQATKLQQKRGALAQAARAALGQVWL